MNVAIAVYAADLAGGADKVFALATSKDLFRFWPEPRDPWDHVVQYRIVDEAKGEVRLRSFGPDGKADTPDDVVWPAGKAWM